MKKRGQITVFIIVGILLLLSVATVIYIYQQRVTAPVKRVVTVPEEVQSIYDYVATCIDQTGKDGLVLMGTQGGFLDIPPVIAQNPNAHVKGDSLGITKIPFWYYEGEDRTPQLENMQRELEVYVKQNLQDCVGDFEPFLERYTITPTKEMIPVITFADNEVIIEVKWALDVTVQNRVIKLEDFISSFSLRFKEMYELAVKTMETENKQGWFENLTIDLMSANTRIPLTGMEFSCGTKKWHMQTVKTELQNTIFYNLPYVRVENTQYPPPLAPISTYNRLKRQAADIRDDLAAEKEPDWPENPPEDVFQMNRMRLDVGIKKTDLKAAFTYLPEWPMLLNAQPNQGGTLSTKQAKGSKKYLQFFCINQWHFTYDIIYPIKMTIRDDTAFNGEGYLFQFAFPVIIEDNAESRVFFGLRKFEIPDMGVEHCQNFGTLPIDIRAVGFVEGGIVAEELDGANITYSCFNQDCLLGETYSDGTGAIRLTSYRPEGCSNPTVTAKKEGYLEGQAQITQGVTEITLTKLQRLPYRIVIHPYYEEVDRNNPTKADKEQWLTAQTYDRFTRDMHATVSISLRGEQAYDQYKLYPASGEPLALLQEEEYELSEIEDVEKDEVDFIWGDANYDIDILLFKGDTPIGGYHTENISIKYRDIASANNAIFHVVEYRPRPQQDWEQAGMFVFLYDRGKYTDGTTPYWTALKPTFT